MRPLLLALVLLWPMVGLADLAAGVEAYERGDYATAVREWRPLAEQGHAKAQTALGVMYDFGRGVPEDDAEAVKWYRLAAEQGYAKAQYFLGSMYYSGESVREDNVQAYAWMNLAAAQGTKSAAKDKKIIRKNMTPADVSEAQKLSRELCAKIPNCAQ